MKPKEVAMFILGALLLICFFIILYCLIKIPMPQDNKDILYLAIGSLLTFVGAVVNYFYGSSAGSAKKDETISNIATKKPDEVTPTQ